MKDDILNIIQSSGVQLGAVKKGTGELYVPGLYGVPQILKLVAHYVSELMEPEVTCVAGRGTGGMPLAAVVSQITGKALILYADKLKDTQGTQLTGYVPTENDFAAIIEDKISAQKSRGITKMIGAIRQTGAKVSGIYAIAKQDDLAGDISGVPYKYLIDIDDDLEGML